MLHSLPPVQSIFTDMPLGEFGIFAETYLPNETAEHIREIFPNQIRALDKIRAYRAAVKAYTASARRIFRARVDTAVFAVAEVLTFPPITDHCPAPLDRP